jgi:SAM-dependent methyltransferase
VLAPLWLRGHRGEAFRQIKGDVVVHDLRKGIPVDSGSVDAVYHSHVLEHIDREDIPAFMAEIHRVLKPGGIHRMAVPNFGRDARDYLESLEQERPNHDDMLIPLLAQSVQREAHGTSLQSPLRRRVENLVLGDARRRGQTHQWAYDRVNLHQILEANGFVDFEVVEPNQSKIPGWVETGLEVDPDGTIYKPGSLWVEARKPN